MKDLRKFNFHWQLFILYIALQMSKFSILDGAKKKNQKDEEGRPFDDV